VVFSFLSIPLVGWLNGFDDIVSSLEWFLVPLIARRAVAIAMYLLPVLLTAIWLVIWILAAFVGP
jgi:hypothetical protein